MISDRIELGEYLNEQKQFGGIVEIGVLFGEYSECLLSTYEGKVFMVDPWVNQDPADYLDGSNACDLKAAFQKVCKMAQDYPTKAYPMKMFSQQAVHSFSDGSLSAVYLDGNHGYTWIKQDLESWWPKIQSGGLMCGHDFYEAHTLYHECGVESAVKEFCEARGITFTTTKDTSFWIPKP